MRVDETLCIVRHNGEEFLFVDFPVLVEIELIYHCLSDNNKKGGHEHEVRER
jgi:hypothetical protein